MLYTACRETGEILEEVSSVEEGIETIRGYEAADIQDDIYEEGFYCLVNENHCEVDI